jgi:hypothetical protein
MEGRIDIRIQDGPGSAEQHPTTQTKSRDEWIQKYVERYQFPPHPTDFPLWLSDHYPGRWFPEDRGHWQWANVAADSSAISRSEYAVLFTAYSRHDSYAWRGPCILTAAGQVLSYRRQSLHLETGSIR